MRSRWLLLVGSLPLAACTAPIAPGQPDGADCNVAEERPCTGDLFCDEGSTRREHTFGFMSSGMHVVGTCRPRGATGAACNSPEACISRNCTHATPEAPGFCAP